MATSKAEAASAAGKGELGSTGGGIGGEEGDDAAGEVGGRRVCVVVVWCMFFVLRAGLDDESTSTRVLLYRVVVILCTPI